MEFPCSAGDPSPRYGIRVTYNEDMQPFGKCSVAIDSAFTLVTTAEFLADPTPKDLKELYEANMGPLRGLGGRVEEWP